MTNHYRKRTPKQTQDKIDRLKTAFMVKKIMCEPERDNLQARIRRILRRRRQGVYPLPSQDQHEIRKVKRLERKLRRMNEGKWRNYSNGDK